jgi:hypothetical protein
MLLLPGLVLGFPQYARGVGKGYTRGLSGRRQHPQEAPCTRMRHRVRAIRADRSFSRPLKNYHPEMICSDPPILPPTSMRHHGLGTILVVSLVVTDTEERNQGQ